MKWLHIALLLATGFVAGLSRAPRNPNYQPLDVGRRLGTNGNMTIMVHNHGGQEKDWFAVASLTPNAAPSTEVFK